MPRRGQVIQRVPLPDAKYGNTALARFINRVMRWGKKLTAQRIVYTSLDIIQRTAKRDPIEVFEQALRNAKPLLEVKPRRVGGATYQVPIEVRATRADALAQRWLIQFARSRAGKSMAERLAAELLDAYHGTGGAVKKREDTHRMAEANKAFAHYRW